MKIHEIETINRCLYRIQNGDRIAAVEELYGVISNAIRFIACKYANNSWDADDLVQDFWLRIPVYAAKYHFGNNGYAYLCKCFRNYCFDWLRKRNREAKTISIEDVLVYETRIDEDATDRQLALDELYRNAAKRMTDLERVVYAYSIHEGKSVRAIAAELQLSKSEIGRARQAAFLKIALTLREMGWDKNDF